MNRNPPQGFSLPSFSISQMVLTGLALISAMLFAAGAVVLFHRLFCPFQVNQGEAVNVEFARLFFQAGSLYRDPSQGPYLHAAYPPLFPFLQRLLFPFVPGPWLAGRLLAFLGYLGCAALLALWGRRYWGNLPTAAFVLMFLLSPTWAAWGSMVRTDSLMIFFEFGAFLLLARMELDGAKKMGGMKGLIGAGLLTSLAVLCKQNAALLFFSYGFFCFMRREGKRFLIFASAAVIPALLTFFYFQWASGGFFFKETVLWISYGYQPKLLLHYLINSFGPECGWLLVSVGFVGLFRKTPLLARCQMAFVLLELLGLGRKTSAENYYLDFILYGIFFMGEGWREAKVGTPNPSPWKPIHGISKQAKPVLALLLAVGFASFNFRPWPTLPSADEIKMKEAVLGIYHMPGEHFALDLDLPLMAGKRLWIQPAEYQSLVEKGFWSPGSLLRDIQSKKFATIELYDIPRQFLLPPTIEDEIGRFYRVDQRAYGRKWYVPR